MICILVYLIGCFASYWTVINTTTDDPRNFSFTDWFAVVVLILLSWVNVFYMIFCFSVEKLCDFICEVFR